MKRSAVTAVVAALAALTACGDAEQPAAVPLDSTIAAPQRIVSGSLFYPERIALPADSVAIIELRDGAAPDGPLLASQRLDLGQRQVPIGFELGVDSARLDQAEAPQLRGAILSQPGPLRVTDALAIDSDGEGNLSLGSLRLRIVPSAAFGEALRCGDSTVAFGRLGELWLLVVDGELFEMTPTRAASGARFAAGDDAETVFWSHGDEALLSLRGVELERCRPVAAANRTLLGDEWNIVSLAGVPLIEDSTVTLAFLEDHRVAGSASCNRFMGGFNLDDEGLRFTSMATTLMACADDSLADQEQRFLELLESVVSFDIDEDGQLLLDAGPRGRIIARR